MALIWYYLTPRISRSATQPPQPVPYSHRLHVGQMGMDCRYCHANVEVAAKAMIPPTQVCMGCHSLVKTDSARLAPVRASWESGKPIEWVQVHKTSRITPTSTISVHLAAGVGCVTCHGRVDQMDVVRAETPLGMGWCLDCHRDPKPNLRPKDQVTNMDWKPEMAAELDRAGRPSPPALLQVPPMSRRQPYDLPSASEPADGAKVFWKSLEDKANPAAAQKRAEAEVPQGLEEAKASSVASSLVKLRRSKDMPAVDDVSVGRRGFMFFAGLHPRRCSPKDAPVAPSRRSCRTARRRSRCSPATSSYYASVFPARGDATRRSRREPRRAPDEGRRQPRAPVEQRRDRRVRPGRHLQPLRPRIVDDADARREVFRHRVGYGSHAPATCTEFDPAHLADLVRTAQADGARPLRFLVERHDSPTFLRLRDAVKSQVPEGAVPHVVAGQRLERS